MTMESFMRSLLSERGRGGQGGRGKTRWKEPTRRIARSWVAARGNRAACDRRPVMKQDTIYAGVHLPKRGRRAAPVFEYKE
jgi:hypothetical protein